MAVDGIGHRVLRKQAVLGVHGRSDRPIRHAVSCRTSPREPASQMQQQRGFWAMQASLEIITTATRVLTALTEKHQPDPSDIRTLYEYDGIADGRDLDVLACDVIQKALRQRSEARNAHSSGYHPHPPCATSDI